MPSPFAAALAQAEVDLDLHMAEDVQIIPMRVGEFAKLPDPDRPAFDVAALVSIVDPSSINLPGGDLRMGYEEVKVEVRRVLLPAGFRFRKGDEMLLLEQGQVPRLIVNRVERLDANRLELVCGPITGD